MRQNDREPRRHGDRSASRVRQATPGSRGWLDTTVVAAVAVAVAVADVDSRSMIPVTALPSRALAETGGLKLSLRRGPVLRAWSCILRHETPGVALCRP